jgi:signal transduction histidine kinase
VIINVVAPGTPASPWLIGALFVPLPATIAAALLRGEFLDIKATLNRALVYTVTTAVLLGVYVGLVELIATAVNRTGLMSTLPATAVIALAFAPLRNRVQRAVERLLYGDRGQPAHVLATLGDRLQVALPPDELLAVVADTIATTLRLPYVALKITGDRETLAYERGESAAPPESVPLVHQGGVVGELVVGPRPGERNLSTADRALLSDLAPHLAASVRAAALITELTDSRTRLAVAREDERARLRHDLHDRLGSRLVGVSLKLDAATTEVDGTALAQPLGQLSDEVRATLDEVRRLARGLRPAELDQLGLLAAVQAAAARLTIGDASNSWQPDVSAAVHLPTLTAEVEAAAYQITLEALTNSYRHSGGHNTHVRIATDASGTRLVLEVSDDGCGLSDHPTEGVGLRSMHERASAVGGSLDITSAPEGGALIRAILPVA